MFGLKLGSVFAEEAAAGGRRLPWVHDIHEYVAGLDTGEGNDYQAVALRHEQRYLRMPSALLTVSSPLAEVLQRRYGLPSPPTVVLNAPLGKGAVESRSDLRGELGLSAETPLVVFVGNANTLRGCDTMLEALTHLEDVHLAFVSQSPFATELKQNSVGMGVSSRFHLLPYVPSNEVPSFIRSADLGIHGLIHYPNGEVALPNKLFEYLQADLPVVVSDVAAMKTFVEEEKVGEVYAAGDAASCTSAIRKALEERERLRSAITDELKGKYSWERQAEAILPIYAELIGQEDLGLAPKEQAEALARRQLESVAAGSRLASAAAEADGVLLRREIGGFAKAAVRNWVGSRASTVRREGLAGVLRRLGSRFGNGRR
jgi:glycosyltransferase involved in cell wall biosynthesis